MSTALYSVVSGICGFFQLCVYVTFFIVTVTAVRSRRPDAWTPLAAGAGTLLLDFMMSWIVGMILPMAMSRSGSGMSGFYSMQAMLTVVRLIISIIGWSLMIIGVVKIASPPREQNLNLPPGGY